nr:immunoglobulin heavy chain junction region [Macaca mulatta]
CARGMNIVMKDVW